MKKLVVLGTALLALNAVASEIQIKAGLDFTRQKNAGVYRNRMGKEETLKKGPVLGLEYIFDNQGEFEWGVGAEYKLSRNSGSLLLDRSANGRRLQNKNKERDLRVAPVYALGKFNLVTTKKGNDALYVLGRVGYGFVASGKDVKEDYHVSGGLYGGVGLGTEMGPISLEALYEKQNYDINSDFGKERRYLDTYGVRLGYRFGKLVNNRQPKVVEKVVERIVEVPVVVPAPAPAPKQIVTNNVTLPISCSTDEKVCVIRGFKVDGREPNAKEAADLRSIANIINQFAEGGTVDFVGHTDSTGSEAYNQKLSVVRAQNVARLLKEYGLSEAVSYGTITGKGETSPADTNSTVKGRYNNRRVELFFNNVDFSNVNFVQ